MTNHTPVPGFTTFTLADLETIRAESRREVLAEALAVLDQHLDQACHASVAYGGDVHKAVYARLLKVHTEIAELGREAAAPTLPNPGSSPED